MQEHEIESRLISGSERLQLSSGRELREQLKSRNIYVPTDQYPSDDGLIKRRMVDSINSVVNFIRPFKSYDLTNTVYGRLVTNPSPLTEIGMVMLGKMFAYNFANRVAAKHMPVIKPFNIFKKDEQVFNFKVNYSITKQTLPTGFGQFLSDLSGYYPNKNNPFSEQSTVRDYINNTGVGVLDIFYGNINRNKYKLYSDNFLRATTENNFSLIKQIDYVSNQSYFNFNSNKFNPYINISTNPELDNFGNQSMLNSFKGISSETQEYAPSGDFIRENLGKVKTNVERNWTDGQNEWVENKNSIQDQIVWGRDGVNSQTNSRLASLRGVSDDEVVPESLEGKFNAKTGLLQYTSNLLNASDGQMVDQTRKIFIRGDKIKGFQGSALWRAPETAPEGIAGKEGIRQHTVLDQYDRYTKAIRFNGNNIYKGNPNSVVNRSVLPKITPYPGDTAADRKKLMFSIENLAVHAISAGDGIGIIDDEKGSIIPEQEVGPFSGRLLWFPPYNIEFSEVSIANWDKTEMVGRNEPIYTYMHSERTGVINFTMLIDHPPQVRNFESEQNKDRELSEFFAFGGSDVPDFAMIPDIENEISRIDSTMPTQFSPISIPDLPTVDFRMSFPNDFPNEDQINNAIQIMYNGKYETIVGETSIYGKNDGLNRDIYNLGITVDNQYTYPTSIIETDKKISSTDDMIDELSELDQQLYRFFSDIENRRFYQIKIDGRASYLYRDELDSNRERYNKELSRRRILAAKKFIQARAKVLFPNNPNIPIVIGKAKGHEGAYQGEFEELLDRIPFEETKFERSALIQFQPSGAAPRKEHVLTPEEEKERNTLLREKDSLTERLNTLKSRVNNTHGSRNEYNPQTINDGVSSHFETISKGKFKQTFHSQTPEDFHRRLTFLQQCTRQGSARRESESMDESGMMRAKNSVFGRQPICIMRIADFYYSKIIINSITYDYVDAPWDMNPEGFGMQPLMVNVTMQIAFIGGQSLSGPIDALQNALSYNYYANSNFVSEGIYEKPAKAATNQEGYIEGILTKQDDKMREEYSNIINEQDE